MTWGEVAGWEKHHRWSVGKGRARGLGSSLAARLKQYSLCVRVQESSAGQAGRAWTFRRRSK